MGNFRQTKSYWMLVSYPMLAYGSEASNQDLTCPGNQLGPPSRSSPPSASVTVSEKLDCRTCMQSIRTDTFSHVLWNQTTSTSKLFKHVMSD
jgi:hypothetical protein